MEVLELKEVKFFNNKIGVGRGLLNGKFIIVKTYDGGKSWLIVNEEEKKPHWIYKLVI